MFGTSKEGAFVSKISILALSFDSKADQGELLLG